MKKEVIVFWFRRDLRLYDNTGLRKAQKENIPILPIFIFDPSLIENLPKVDKRISFIYQALIKTNKKLKTTYSSSLGVFFDTPNNVFNKLQERYIIKKVFINHDYEPFAIKRDLDVKINLMKNKIPLVSFKDQVIFERSEVVKKDNSPYVVYTPYKLKWKEQYIKNTPSIEKDKHLNFQFIEDMNLPFISISDLGFEISETEEPTLNLNKSFFDNYSGTRDFPFLERGTSRIGKHLRFGTISIREVVSKAFKSIDEGFLNELIWREFFMQILWHFPHTINKAFKPKYDRIIWRNNLTEFEKWKKGETGYPLVDAGMKELYQTGYMHNRVRMLVASFLCKHLLIDWRWGEAYFAEKLIDYELSSNVGNWQWAAGSGVDAAPYFRIFNPITQLKKFDNDFLYINKWLPNFQSLNYPDKIVDHKFARERCLKVYKEALI